MKSVSFLCGIILSGLAAGAWAKEPLFEGIGAYTRTITTNSPEAQKYFNQGLAFLHGFNHGEAIRSFQEAARLDPGCAMAHWGVALACGPHINFPVVPPPAAQMAWEQLQLARDNAAAASPVERDLIDALAHRYAKEQPEDRRPLDQSYADAMRKVWKAHTDDPDVGAFFAEALLDLRPWDQWTREGQPQPGTQEVLATLEAVLKLSPNHPLANHLYIHAVEASPHPERALSAADRLRNLQPAIAHNVHMPSHIDIRMGHWHQAITANLKAIEADRRYRRITAPPAGLIVAYAAHNQHMLAYAAMMTGQSDLAITHIRAMVADLPPEFLRQFPAVGDVLAAMPLEALVRFGKWDQVLAEPEITGQNMPFSRAFRHAARGIAFAARGDTISARAEQKSYLEAEKQVPAEALGAGNNPPRIICSIITPMLEGEILIRKGKLDAGLAQLRAAIRIEDGLQYDEPPGWLIPVRHSLGAALMRAGRFAEAEQVYRQDLERLPENGWSLYGLTQSLGRQGKTRQAAAARERFEKIWARADLKINSSCMCQPGE